MINKPKVFPYLGKQQQHNDLDMINKYPELENNNESASSRSLSSASCGSNEDIK